MAQQQLLTPPVIAAAGAVTLTFPQPARGGVWEGIVSVPNSPNTVVWSLIVNTKPLATIPGSSTWGPVHFAQGDTMTLKATGGLTAASYQGLLVGRLVDPGVPPIPFPTSTFQVVTNSPSFPTVLTVRVIALPAPPSNVSSILTRRVTLAGTTTPTAHRKPLATTTSFTTLKIGVQVTGTPTNAGKRIYVAGSNVTTGSYAISATTGVLTFAWRTAHSIYLLGTSGDIANVWAE